MKKTLQTTYLSIFKFLSMSLLWLAMLPAGAQSVSFDGNVSTLAGSSLGNVNATGTNAKFNYPYGTAVDLSGNVYVADFSNHCIRKITPGGVVTLFAGSTLGYKDDTGPLAQFNYPTGVAVDATGNVYVADSKNNCIRVITPGGVVTTLAGSTAGNVNDTGIAAKFNNPVAVAVDASNNVYVADQTNHSIRMVNSAGVVTTLAGSGVGGFAQGTGTAAQFNLPTGVAVDASFNVYVADQNNQRIRMITSGGVVSTLAGSSTSGIANGTGAAAQFNGPTGVAVDGSGNVFVADNNNNLIRKVTSAGAVTTYAGDGNPASTDGTTDMARFKNPNSLSVDASDNVYVADTYNHRIRKIIPVKISPFSNTNGTPSASQTFQVSGNGLTTDLIVTAPIGYEVSLDGTSYSSSVNLTPLSGTVYSTPVYIRLSAIAGAGANNGNISLTSAGAATQTFAVTGTTADRLSQTITFNAFATPITFVLNQTFTLSASSTSSLQVYFTSSNTAVATVSGNTVTIKGGGTTTITAKQDGDVTYKPAPDEVQTLEVDQASQTINFAPFTSAVKVGDQFSITPATSSAGLSITYTSSDPAVVKIQGNTATVLTVGTGSVDITASQAGNNNYSAAAPVMQSLAVEKGDQTITFTLPSKTTADAPFDLDLLASSNSQLPITFASDNDAVATIGAGNIVTIHSAGTVNITASQGGSDDYVAAIPMTLALVVTTSTGIKNFMMLESKIYPNPTADVLYIEPQERLYGNLTLSISNMQGKTVYSSKIQGGEESYKVDISMLETGVYVLELSNGKRVVSQRIVKK